MKTLIATRYVEFEGMSRERWARGYAADLTDVPSEPAALRADARRHTLTSVQGA